MVCCRGISADEIVIRFFLSLFIRFHMKTVIDVCLNETAKKKKKNVCAVDVCISNAFFCSWILLFHSGKNKSKTN